MQQGSKLGLAVAGCLSPIVKFVRYDLSPPPAEVPSAPGERDDEPDESDSSSDDDEPPLTRVVAGGLGRAQQTGLALAGLLLGGRRGVVLGGGVAVTALRLLSEGGLAGGENKGKE